MNQPRPLLLLILLALATGCIRTSPRRPPRPRPSPVATIPARPLPPPPRPVGVATRLVPAMPASRCEPVQVGPGRWITPMCESLPPVWVKPFHGGSFLDQQAVPKSVDLRQRGLTGPVKDQGQVGVCWAFALSSTMDATLRHDGYVGTVSPLHAVAKKTWDALYRNSPSAPPLTVESRWPYDPRRACAFQEEDQWCGDTYDVDPGSWRSDPTLAAELSAADRDHHYRFHDVEPLEVQPANPNQLTRVLADGDAIWASFAFDRKAWSFSALRDGTFSDYSPSRSDGHAVVLVGYRTVGLERQFLLQNSWGPDWADGGFAWMPEHVLRRHLTRAFRLSVSPTRATPKQHKSEPPAPMMCHAGQVRDLVTGACAQPCGGFFPPVNGVCPGLPSIAKQGGGCAQGQTRDVATGSCVATCPSGLPPAMGVCLL